MQIYSRRSFLKRLAGAGAVLALGSQGAFPVTNLSGEEVESFEFLVAGDSLVWGQGLREEDKFYSHVKNWLEATTNQPVSLKIKAHSGARISLTSRETAILDRAEIDLNENLFPEINVSFPSLRAQIDRARREYKAENRQTENVRLIMFTGGITDINISEILNPFASDDRLKNDIVKYCYDSMFDLLEHAAQNFPNAVLTVVGYYPIVSRETPADQLFNAVLELYRTPRFLKPAINNPVKRQLLLRRLRNKMIHRSNIWHEDSNREFGRAVDRFNRARGKQTAIFVRSPITENHGFAATETLLWEFGKKGRATDDLSEERKNECAPALKRLRRATGHKFRARRCELASLGHPNPAGARLIAEAIKNSLMHFF